MADYEVKVRSLKDDLYSEALLGTSAPRILDVGCGSGPNLQLWASYQVSSQHARRAAAQLLQI